MPGTQPILNDVLPPKKTERAPPRRRFLFSFLFFSCALLVAIFTIVGFIGYRKTLALRAATTTQFRAASDAAAAFNVHDASAALAPLARRIERADQYSAVPAIIRTASFLERLSPTIGIARNGLHTLTTLATSTFHALETVDTISRNAFRYLFRGGGSKLLALIQSISADVATIRTATDTLGAAATRFRIPFPLDTLTIVASLGNVGALMTRVLDILNTPDPQHFLLLFQNPSEIRPSGGFLGSYADITIHGGNVTNIDVRDIYDPDGQLVMKTLAPRALQRISPRWEARDANWFFDFPTSAAKVLSFLEASKIYAERGTRFIGAIAVNVPIVQDLLATTGPIELPDYQLTIDEKNFLAEVQREVESGADNKAGRPKRILRVLTPLVLEKLADLSNVQKRLLIARLQNRIRTKELQFYFRDRALETYVQSMGFGGDIYAPEMPDYDDYIAFVRANIAGGKTDILIDETVAIESTVDALGVVHNTLTVSRSHRGDTETAWWYRMANQLFFQLLTPYGSTLLDAQGHDAMATPTVNRPTYAPDPDVVAIESTLQFPKPHIEQFAQFGKITFAGWLTVPAGNEKTLSLDYQLPTRVTLEDGARYRAIIERQSGSRERFRYTLHAPSGFIWKESQSSDFLFASDDLDGRTILEMTLQKK